MPLPNTGAYNYQSSRSVAVGRKNVLRGLSGIHHQQWVTPPAKVTNNLLTAKTGAALPNVGTITYAPDGAAAVGPVGSKIGILLAAYGLYTCGRNVVITVTHGSAVIAMTGVITGIDIYGQDMTENWSVTAGTVSKTFTGLKSFKQITSISLTSAGDATTNTVIAGDGDVLGLDLACPVGAVNAAVKEFVDGGILVSGTIVAAGTGTADRRGTYLPAAAPNGARTYDLFYISDNPETSG